MSEPTLGYRPELPELEYEFDDLEQALGSEDEALDLKGEIDDLKKIRSVMASTLSRIIQLMRNIEKGEDVPASTVELAAVRTRRLVLGLAVARAKCAGADKKVELLNSTVEINVLGRAVETAEQCGMSIIKACRIAMELITENKEVQEAWVAKYRDDLQCIVQNGYETAMHGYVGTALAVLGAWQDKFADFDELLGAVVKANPPPPGLKKKMGME